MKKIIPFLLIMFLLAGCTLSSQVSDAEMATRVAQILTSYPTNTVDPNVIASETAAAAFSATQTAITPTKTATVTPTITPTVTSSPTAAVTATETQTPAATLSQTQAAAIPSITITAPANDPVARLGNPTSLDTMDGPTAWNWTVGPSKFTNLAFNSGTMLLTANSETAGWRLAGTESLDNVFIEMIGRLEKCTGTDNYGIIFRVPALNEANRGYLFGLTCSGSYYLKSWDGKIPPEGKMTTLIPPTQNDAIVQGGGVFNRLGLMAVGNRLTLYANGVYLGEYQDSSYPAGYFGVFVNQDNTPYLTLRVEQMRYWKNPVQ